MPEAGTPRVEPLRSRRDQADAGPSRDASLDDGHLDLVVEPMPASNAGSPNAGTAPPEGIHADEAGTLVWRSAPAETGAGTNGVEAEPDVEAERDRWRERAIVWRERALAAEVVAKEMSAHLADVRENLEDVRVAMRALTEQQAAIGARPTRPRTGWRAYVAQLLDLDR